MRRIISGIAILFLPLALAAQPRTTYPRIMYASYDHAPVYTSASYMSDVIGELQRGDSVTALASEKRYFRVRHGEREGYVLWSNLALTIPKGKVRRESPSKSRASSGKKNADASKATADTTGPARRAASDTLAKHNPGVAHAERPQCIAVTKSGKRCSRKASEGSDYCWQHARKQ